MESNVELARDDSATEELLTSVAQRMAHSEKKSRDRALRNIRRWLARNGEGIPLNRKDVAKLWRALFVCMWMSDKPLVQEQLAESISALSENFNTHEAAFLFLEEFFVVMAVKWNGIDKWRFDKFLMLVRKMVRQIFIRGANSSWDPNFVSGLVIALKNTVCKVEPPHLTKTPLGLKLHVADLFCEELAKVGINEHLTTETVVSLLRPYMDVVQQSRDARFVIVVVKRVFDYLLKQSDAVIRHDIFDHYGVSIEADEEEEDAEEMHEQKEKFDDEDAHEGLTLSSGALDPRAGGVNVEVPQLPIDYNKFHEVFLELAGAPGIRQKTRNMLYSLVKKFKDVASDVYPFPKFKVDRNDLKRLGEDDYQEAVTRMEEFEKQAFVDSGKNYTRAQKKKDRKALKRLQSGANSHAVSSDGMPKKTVAEKRKRVEKYAQLRSGRKHRKVMKTVKGPKKGRGSVKS